MPLRRENEQESIQPSAYQIRIYFIYTTTVPFKESLFPSNAEGELRKKGEFCFRTFGIAFFDPSYIAYYDIISSDILKLR